MPQTSPSSSGSGAPSRLAMISRARLARSSSGSASTASRSSLDDIVKNYSAPSERSRPLPAHRGEAVGGVGEEVALEEVAAELDQGVAFGGAFDALDDDAGAEVFADRVEGVDQFLFEWVLVDVAGQRHVDLDHLGGEGGEAGEAGVTGAQVVEGDAVAEAAERGEARRQVGHLLQRLAIGHLEDDAAGERRQRSPLRRQLVVEELGRVQVDEQQ